MFLTDIEIHKPVIAIYIAALCFLSMAFFILFVIVKNHFERLKLNKQAYESILETQENERRRISQDLHDNFGMVLAAILLQIDNISETTHEKNTSLELKELSTHVSIAIDQLRQIVKALTPVNLKLNGWINELKEFILIIKKSSSIEFNIIVHENLNRLNENTELNLLRIIQELLTNTLRHANASKVIIEVSMELNNLVIEYADDGEGFGKIKNSNGYGLQNIQSRVNLLNGKYSYNTGDKGTSFKFIFDTTLIDKHVK